MYSDLRKQLLCPGNGLKFQEKNIIISMKLVIIRILFLAEILETLDFQTTPEQEKHQHIQKLLFYKNYFYNSSINPAKFNQNDTVANRKSLIHIVTYSAYFENPAGP